MRLPWALILVVAGGLAPSAQAHEAFSEYIWHRVTLGAKGRHLDVTVQLTFFEEWSLRERARMDADRDGRVSRREREAYLAKLGDEIKERLRLTIGGRAVSLVALYEPTLDLMGNDGAMRAHHELTLQFFAVVPTASSPSVEVALESRLWAAARSQAEIALATNGARVLADPKALERAPHAPTEQPLRFVARLETDAL